MNEVAATSRFTRAEGVLWRDTGRHVVALPAAPHSEVLVLGGGSAVVWRLLERPLTPPQLRELVEGTDAQPAPSVETLVDCLVELVDREVVVAVPEGQLP